VQLEQQIGDPLRGPRWCDARLRVTLLERFDDESAVLKPLAIGFNRRHDRPPDRLLDANQELE
jgi:hypothetical protein